MNARLISIYFHLTAPVYYKVYCKHQMVLGKVGRNWVLHRFQQLNRSYRDEIETRNREEIPYSSRIVPMGSFCCRRTIDRPSQRRTFIKRPGQPAWGSSRDSNLRTHAWEPGIVTTREFTCYIAMILCLNMFYFLGGVLAADRNEFNHFLPLCVSLPYQIPCK